MVVPGVSAAGVKSPFGCSFKKVSCSSLEEKKSGAACS